MTTQRIMIAGFGGQGVMLIGQILAYAGMLEGNEVTWMPSYGPEMRGGTANCSVIISDKKISSPIISEATTLVVLNEPSLHKFENLLSSGGMLFINSSLVNVKPVREDINFFNVDTNKIAANLKSDKTSNMIMLGAIVRKTEIVKLESVEKVVEKLFSGNKSKFIPDNIMALRAWE